MPTKREREYYRMGFDDGKKYIEEAGRRWDGNEYQRDTAPLPLSARRKPKRKLSAWNKFVKQNSKKPRFRYARSNKINLKKMAVAFRKTKRR